MGDDGLVARALAGVPHPEPVHLDEVVAGVKPGRLTDDEIIIFDSTGVAIEDVAAGAIVYERALAGSAGLAIRLGN